MKPTDELAYELGRAIGRWIAIAAARHNPEQVQAMLQQALKDVAGKYERLGEIENAIEEFRGGS